MSLIVCSYLAVIAHLNAHVLNVAPLPLAAMHLIVHDPTHLCLFLEALTVAVELRVLKLRTTKLGQDLLAETSA